MITINKFANSYHAKQSNKDQKLCMSAILPITAYHGQTKYIAIETDVRYRRTDAITSRLHTCITSEKKYRRDTSPSSRRCSPSRQGAHSHLQNNKIHSPATPNARKHKTRTIPHRAKIDTTARDRRHHGTPQPNLT